VKTEGEELLLGLVQCAVWKSEIGELPGQLAEYYSDSVQDQLSPESHLELVDWVECWMVETAVAIAEHLDVACPTVGLSAWCSNLG
jgi:hypothetical protein